MDYIIELALNNYTDFSKFEEISTRILNDEGYETIHAIGGIGDEGMDGEETRYFQDGIERTVFQYSLDKRNKQKIIDTIEKLAENGISYQSIVFVTINQINNIQTLKSEIRKQYKSKFEIEIIERRTILSRLSANNYSLFNTYFPNVRAQIENSYFNKKVYFSDESSDLLETSLLKCSLLFTFNNNAQITRKDLFDKLILSIIAPSKETTIKKIEEVITKKFAKPIDEGQIKASVQRLSKEDLVKEKSGVISPTKKSVEFIEGNLAKVNAETDALINDIIEKFRGIEDIRIDNATLSRLKSNIQNSFSEFFRLHGVDYSNAGADTISTDYGYDKNAALINITKEGLSAKLGSMLVYSIGDTLRNPTNEQAKILSQWAKAFISLQIMNLDPTLKEFQATSFAQKVFVIDTDFLLYCIVSECPLNKVYKRLAKHLKSLKCKLVIPPNVIAEVLKHGEAERHYSYFRATFENVDENVIGERIHNVFVKGYYSGIISGEISKSTSFKDYLSNYIDKDAPYKYLVDLINHYYPDTFIVQELTSLATVNVKEEILTELTGLINDLTISTFKAQWRTGEENYELSLNDAKMYLTTYYLNDASLKDEKAILPGKYYLLTSSTRAARCGLKIGLKTSISVRPETLIGLLDQLGSFEISAKEYINVFENPYLVEIANECWDDIKVLIDSGVSLIDKNPVKLKYELRETIHEYIIQRNTYDSKQDEIDEKNLDDIELKDFAKFAKHIKAKGYQFTPSITEIMEKFKEMQTDIKNKDEIISELKEKTALFGKRKQHYFEKISK
ncbi:MAG TPA: hypothetical protein VIJ75_21300 [Hanamia sp.]